MMSRKIVFSIATGGYNWLYRDCIRSHKRYARGTGAHYEVFSGCHTLSASVAAWLKVPLICRFLSLGYQQVMFVDADCTIREGCEDFEALIPEGKAIGMANGWSGRINSGVIICQSSDSLVEKLISMLDDCESEVADECKAPYENGHFIAWFGACDLWCELDKRWNSIAQHASDDFIWHYTGPNKRKVPHWFVLWRKATARLTQVSRSRDRPGLRSQIDEAFQGITAKIG